MGFITHLSQRGEFRLGTFTVQKSFGTMTYLILTDKIGTAGDSLCKADKPKIHVYSDASKKAIPSIAFVKDPKTGK